MTGSHAGFHLCVNITVLDFRGIALSKTVALTLLIILIRIHNVDYTHISVYACQILLKVKVSNDQEMVQSERNSHSKIRGWKTLN